ncbi:hypothetical protein A5892_12345 [Halotalea alkalilenta]|uniref:Uncharacterized protein n=2 Tax=Halotalea alkalilenta TaxID=376489 RepID=A0A172YG33_9GAMM|nr:hypothetical protein A5892_12345 [Halotalea alkalilenta]
MEMPSSAELKDVTYPNGAARPTVAKVLMQVLATLGICCSSVEAGLAAVDGNGTLSIPNAEGTYIGEYVADIDRSAAWAYPKIGVGGAIRLSAESVEASDCQLLNGDCLRWGQNSEAYFAPPDGSEPAAQVGPVNQAIVIGDSQTTPEKIRPFADLTGIPIYSYSMSGTSSPVTLARMGAVPMRLTFPDNQIPASGSVTVNHVNDPYRLAENVPATNHTVYINGVRGQLVYVSPLVYSFTREQPGEVVEVPSPVDVVWERVPLRLETFDSEGNPQTISSGLAPIQDNMEYLQIFWFGGNSRNNPIENQIGYYQAAYNNIKSQEKRFIFVSWFAQKQATGLPAQLQRQKDVAAALEALYGRHYIDPQPILLANPLPQPSTPLNPDDPDSVAEWDAYEADQTAVAGGIVPPSLMIDNTHINLKGRLLIWRVVAERCAELGYIDKVRDIKE